MKFGALDMAVWLWIVPIIILFFVMARKDRVRAMRRFAENGLLPEISASASHARRRAKHILIVLAVFFSVIALMRPQWGFKWQEVKRMGIDIIIALDTSNSMLAEDVRPNRLERSKLAIKDMVAKLNGDRIGLVAFSGTAFLQCPLTVDYDGFMLSLNDVAVDTIPVGGTSLARAIYKAVESFEGGKKEHKILILVTDGEDHEGSIDRAIKEAKDKGVTIYCVGIGSAEGELVPIKDNKGVPKFLQDAEGKVVKSRLMETTLQKIAVETGGMYVHATGAEFGLDLIYKEKLQDIEKQEFKSKMEKRYNEKFQIPLALAMLLLFIEPLLGERKAKLL